MPHIRNVGRVRPQSFFECASRFKRRNGTGTKNIFKKTVRFCLSLVFTYFFTSSIVYLGLVYVTMITETRSESTVVRGVTGV